MTKLDAAKYIFFSKRAKTERQKFMAEIKKAYRPLIKKGM